jgi:hypothetical protein
MMGHYSSVATSFIFVRVRVVANTAYQLRNFRPSVSSSDCPSVRMNQRGSHWTDISKIR